MVSTMNNQEILTKAIEKAIANGWNCELRQYSNIDQVFYIDMSDNPALEELIYNRDFAKALWGDSDDDRITILGETDWKKWPLAWQYHLQQMVIADDPIEYLGDNL